MTIRHHPSDEIMLRYANGSLNHALGLVVRAHMDVCAICRETLALAEALGGELLDSAMPAEMSADVLSRVMDLLDEPVAPPKPQPAAKPEPDLSLPPALQDQNIGGRRWLAPGIWARPIVKDAAAGTRAYLLGAGAGKAIPHHGHAGIELTQVLEGEFFDGDVCYGPGDFLEAEGEHQHRPVVGANKACVCVIASEGVPSGIAGVFMRIFT